MKRRLARCLIALLGAVMLTTLILWQSAADPAPASSDIHCVNQTGTNCAAVCGGGCYSSLQAAEDAAAVGHEIRVASGTYAVPGGGTVVAVTKELRILGGFDPTCATQDPDVYHTVLDAQWGGSVISITNAGDVQLLFLTLTHGDGTGNCDPMGCGGGIYANGTNLHVGHCVVTDNVGSKAGGQMGMGGGIYAYTDSNGVIDLWNSRVVSNTANTDPSSASYSYGGGVFIRYATAVLKENEILDNVGSTAGAGGAGGGVYLYGVSHADVLTNTIRGNVGSAHNSGASGGGIYILGFHAYLSGNLIQDNWTAPNWAGYGGGVYLSNQTEAHLTRNTIVNNGSALQNTGWVAPGGGVYIGSDDPVTLTNNVIAYNMAAGNYGGGVYVDLSLSGGRTLLANNTIANNGATGVVVYRNADLTLINNLIAGHTVGMTNTQPSSSIVTADYNLFWNSSDPIVGTNSVLADPRLAQDCRPYAGSPALDAGLTLSWLTVDLVGTPRPQGSAYDIGAFEGEAWGIYLPLVTRQ